jgi:hypothetical protein
LLTDTPPLHFDSLDFQENEFRNVYGEGKISQAMERWPKRYVPENGKKLTSKLFRKAKGEKVVVERCDDSMRLITAIMEEPTGAWCDYIFQSTSESFHYIFLKRARRFITPAHCFSDRHHDMD